MNRKMSKKAIWDKEKEELLRKEYAKPVKDRDLKALAEKIDMEVMSLRTKAVRLGITDKYKKREPVKLSEEERTEIIRRVSILVYNQYIR